MVLLTFDWLGKNDLDGRDCLVSFRLFLTDLVASIQNVVWHRTVNSILHHQLFKKLLKYISGSATASASWLWAKEKDTRHRDRVYLSDWNCDCPSGHHLGLDHWWVERPLQDDGTPLLHCRLCTRLTSTWLWHEASSAAALAKDSRQATWQHDGHYSLMRVKSVRRTDSEDVYNFP